MTIEELVDQFPETIPAAAIDSVIKGQAVIDRYSRPVCFMMACKPGDDVLIDLVSKIDADKRVSYYVICTMDEYNVIAEHIKYLERKYGVYIDVAVVTTSPERTLKNFSESSKADLVITAERKDGSVHPTCVTVDNDWIDSYRPLFWFTDKDMTLYDRTMGIVHAEVRT